MPDIFQIAEGVGQKKPEVRPDDIFSIAENPAGYSGREFVKRAAGSNTPYESVEARFKELGLDASSLKQDFQMAQSRYNAGNVQRGVVEKGLGLIGLDPGNDQQETTLQKFGRSYMPFGDFLGMSGAAKYTDAKKRLAEGKATKEDTDTIARFELLQQRDASLHDSTMGRLADNVGGLAKIVGETTAVAGGLGKAGAVTGIGQAEKATRLGAFAQGAGKVGLTTALSPAMYVGMAQQKNLAEGRAANDWKGYPTAVGYGLANMVVLGRLQNGIKGGNAVTNALKKGATGTAELAGVDVAAGLADDFLLNKAWQTGTKYGTLGQLARGSGLDLGGKADAKELQPGLEHAAFQVLSFSALAAAHGRPGEPVVDRFKAELDRLANAGVSPEAAGAQVDRRISPVEQLLRDPNMTREKAQEAVGDTYQSDPLVRSLIDTLPSADPFAATEAKPAGRQNVYVERVSNEGRFPAEPQPAAPPPPGRPPIYRRKGIATLQSEEAPRAASPVEVLGEKGIRDFAKELGFKGTGAIEEVLNRIRSSPSAAGILANRMEKAAPREIAPEAAPSSEPAPTPVEPVATPENAATTRPGPLLGEGKPGSAVSFGSKDRFTRFDFKDEKGNSGYAEVRLNDKGDLYANWIGLDGAATGEGKGKLGAATATRLAEELANKFPEAKRLTGIRAAAGEAGAGNAGAGKTGEINLDAVRKRMERKGLDVVRPAEKPAAVETGGKSEAWRKVYDDMLPLVGPETARAIADKDAGGGTPAPAAPASVPGAAGGGVVGARPEMVQRGIPDDVRAALRARRPAPDPKANIDVTAQERGIDREFARTPYGKLPKAVRAKAEPLMDRLAAELGVGREVYEDSLRHAYLSVGRDGKNGVADLLDLWRSRTDRMSGSADELDRYERELKEAQDAERQLEEAAIDVHRKLFERVRRRSLEGADQDADSAGAREAVEGGRRTEGEGRQPAERTGQAEEPGREAATGGTGEGDGLTEFTLPGLEDAGNINVRVRNGTARVSSVGVKPAHRDRGIGQLLYLEALGRYENGLVGSRPSHDAVGALKALEAKGLAVVQWADPANPRSSYEARITDAGRQAARDRTILKPPKEKGKPEPKGGIEFGEGEAQPAASAGNVSAPRPVDRAARPVEPPAEGGKYFGEAPGRKVSFSTKYYEPAQAVKDGTRATVLTRPVVSPEGQVVKRGTVQAVDRLAAIKQARAIKGTSERAGKVGASEWVNRESELRDQGIVTLGDHIRTEYGGIDPADFRKNFGEGEYREAVENFGKSMFAAKDGGAGTGKVEDILMQLQDNGTLPRELTPYDLLERIGKHTPIDSRGGDPYAGELDRRAAAEARAGYEEQILAENPEISAAEMDREVDKLMKAELARPKLGGEEDLIPFHTPGDAATLQPLTPERVKTVGPFELIQSIDRILDITSYTENKIPFKGGAQAGAAAVLKSGPAAPEAVVTKKMFAGDPAVRLEEAGHVLAARYGMELVPDKLPAGVAEGFRQFWGKPLEAQSRLSTLEGFSVWLKERASGNVTADTPEKKAAAEFAERFVEKNDLGKRLDQVGELFRAWQAIPPLERAAKLLSSTGQEVRPDVPVQERVKQTAEALAENFRDAMESHLGPLYRAEAAVEKRIGRKLTPDEKASTLYSQLMYKEASLAGEFQRDGVKTLKGGKWVTVGQSEAKVLEGSKPEWLAPLFEGGPSKFDIYTVARHIEGEFKRIEGEKARKEAPRAEPVPEAQRKQYADAMAELAKDAEFMAWAEPAADRLTKAFLATRQAMESPDIHLLKEGRSEQLDKERPDYVPLERVLTDRGWQTSKDTVAKARTGSGEQIVSPLVSYRKRLRVVATLMADQIKRNAVARLAQFEGMGDYLLAGEARVTKAGEAQITRVADRLKELGLDGSDANAVLKQLGVEDGVSYFTSRPWEKDGSKNTLEWVGPDGKVTNFRVKDEALYNLLTDQQTQASQIARVLNGIANVSIAGFRPIRAMTDLVKLGATSANLAFQARNIPRDAFTFWTNTVNRASVKELPDALRRAVAFEWGVLKANLAGGDFKSADHLFKLFHDLRGDQLRQFAFDPRNPTSAADAARTATLQSGKAIKAASSLWGVAKDMLNVTGAGELAPRFVEFKNRMRELTGLSEKELVAKLEAADGAAAEGKRYENPFDFNQMMEAMEAAAEVTTNFGRQGYVSRELNKIQPYFGPAVAGLSKMARNVRDNPKGAAMGLAAIASLRLMHWLAFSDEKWYQELGANDRYRNFVVPTPAGLRRIPSPRGLEVPVGGFLLPVLDAMKGTNPDVKGLLSATLDDLSPPLPVTPAGKAAFDIARNENWRGSPIVPRRDEGLTGTDKAVKYQIPYAAEQMTGGRGLGSFRGAGLVPFTEVQNARRSTDDVYAELASLTAARTSAKNRGEKFGDEARFKKLERVTDQIQEIGRQIRGEKLVGGKVVKGEEPTDERKRELREKQTTLARKALGRE